jgi:hypothetical protein
LLLTGVEPEFTIVTVGATVFVGKAINGPTDFVNRDVAGAPLTAVTLTTKCLASSASFGV